MFKFGDALAFAHFGSLSHGIVFLARDNVSFKFGGVDKYTVYFFVCIKIFFAMLLIGHNLHHNCELHVIGVFNLFEHCISLEIPIFNLCVGLNRLHLFD
jgi:hypothetical protein